MHWLILLLINMNEEVGNARPVSESMLIFSMQVALLCSQSSPKDRPKMSEVVKMLEGEGLEEHWDEWQKMELTRMSEMPSYSQIPTISNWTLDSTAYEPSVELSGPR